MTAYNEGKLARRAGRAKADNPYTKDPTAFMWFETGWMAEDHEIRMQRKIIRDIKSQVRDGQRISDIL